MTMQDAAFRLVVAAALSALIGIEREASHKSAGLRTNMLVGLGAALFSIIGDELGDTRIPAQIVTGVGFLGAGAILKDGASIRGLTTAAGMWAVAAIGTAAGSGFLLIAALATAVTLVVLFGLRPLDDRIGKPNV